MSFLKDFKAFAMRGSIMDLAVGVVIGAAFGKIVTSMVEDILMPLISILGGKGKLFTDMFVLLSAKEGEHYDSLDAAKKAGANVFAYGHFLQSIIDFLIIAFFIFATIRFMARFQRKQEEAKAVAEPAPSSTDKLLMEIRDLLQDKK